MKNLDTGQYLRLTATQESEAHPEISPDGSLVAYFSSYRDEASVGSGRIQSVPTLGGVAEVLCQGCAYPWNFTSDNRRLAFNQFPRVYLLDIPTKRKTSLLKPSGSAIWQAKFSPDGRWITFGESSASVGRSRLFVAPFQTEGEISEEEWIALTDGSTVDDKPRWSPEGNLMYFTSKRDGFVCLWAQRLDPTSKRPRDAAFVVYHLHQARRSLGHGGYYEISVARDKIVFNLGELTGNIWMTKLVDQP
jgi:Tol biopolymer transport system component